MTTAKQPYEKPTAERTNFNMRDIELFLKLLANCVYAARLGNGNRLTDATDFKRWLEEASVHASHCGTLKQFFDSMPHE